MSFLLLVELVAHRASLPRLLSRQAATPCAKEIIQIAELNYTRYAWYEGAAKRRQRDNFKGNWSSCLISENLLQTSDDCLNFVGDSCESVLLLW